MSCKQHSKRVNVVQKRHCNTIIPCPSFFLKKRDSTSTNNLLCMRLLNICPNGRCHLIRLGKLSFLNHVSKCTGLKTYKRLFFFFSFLRSSHNFCSKNPTLKLCQPNIRFDTGKGVAQVALIRVVNAWKLLIVLTLQTLDKQIDRVLKIGLLRINHQSHFLRRSILGDFLQSCNHVVQFTNLVLMKWFCYFPQMCQKKQPSIFLQLSLTRSLLNQLLHPHTRRIHETHPFFKADQTVMRHVHFFPNLIDNRFSLKGNFCSNINNDKNTIIFRQFYIFDSNRKQTRFKLALCQTERAICTKRTFFRRFCTISV